MKIPLYNSKGGANVQKMDTFEKASVSKIFFKKCLFFFLVDKKFPYITVRGAERTKNGSLWKSFSQ